MSLEQGDLTRGDLVNAALSAQGLKPPAGGGGAPAPKWFANADISSLAGAYDFRGLTGGSALTLDANNALSTVSDLSGNGNDATHWRGTAVNVEKALLGGTSGIDQYVDCRGNQDADEKHWGFNGLSLFGAVTALWHHFAVLRIPNHAGLKTQASTSSTGIYYYFPASAGTSGRPRLTFDSSGGSASTSNYATLVSGAGGQMESPPSVNIESLTGRQETAAASRVALVEFRRTGSKTQVWVNGHMVEEQDPNIATDAMGYVLYGKRDLNFSSGPLQLFAHGVGWNADMPSEAQAASIRASILADFGIETWDGSSYPS